MDKKIIDENEYYSFVYRKNESALIFDWKEVENIPTEVFKEFVTNYANLCEKHEIKFALINVEKFKVELEFDVQSWWMNDIVPIYNQAGIELFGYVTGDPNAEGLMPQTPPGVNFNMGFFTDTGSALAA